MNGASENPQVNEYNQEQEENEESNVVSLKLVSGGNPPADGDWLSPLEIGTVFLARNRQNLNDYNLGLFRLIEKDSGVYAVLRNPQIPHNLYFIPAVFCKAYSKHCDLGVIADVEIDTLVGEQEPMKEG